MKDWEGDKACRVVCHPIIAYRHEAEEMQAMAGAFRFWGKRERMVWKKAPAFPAFAPFTLARAR